MVKPMANKRQSKAGCNTYLALFLSIPSKSVPCQGEIPLDSPPLKDPDLPKRGPINLRFLNLKLTLKNSSGELECTFSHDAGDEKIYTNPESDLEVLFIHSEKIPTSLECIPMPHRIFNSTKSEGKVGQSKMDKGGKSVSASASKTTRLEPNLFGKSPSLSAGTDQRINNDNLSHYLALFLSVPIETVDLQKPIDIDSSSHLKTLKSDDKDKKLDFLNFQLSLKKSSSEINCNFGTDKGSEEISYASEKDLDVLFVHSRTPPKILGNLPNPRRVFKFIKKKKMVLRAPSETRIKPDSKNAATPLFFRMVLEDSKGKPYAFKDYLLTVDNKDYRGQTNEFGLVEQQVPKNSRKGRLSLLSDNPKNSLKGITWDLTLE